MLEPFLIEVKNVNGEFIASTEGDGRRGTSRISATLAADDLMASIHGSRHFVRFKRCMSQATFMVAPKRGGFRG